MLSSSKKFWFLGLASVFVAGCATKADVSKAVVKEKAKTDAAAVVMPVQRLYSDAGGAGRYTAEKQHVLTLQAPLDGKYVNLNEDSKGSKKQFVEMKMPPPVVKTVEAFEAEIVVYFKTNSSELTKEAVEVISGIASNSNRISKVKISGHADGVGSEEKNKELSKSRVQAVVDALVNAGVGEDSINASFYGDKKPAAENLTTGGRAQNRRVEISVSGEKSTGTAKVK